MSPLLSHIITFASGLTVGIFGNLIASRLAERAKAKDTIKDRMVLFNKAEQKMPELFTEIREDLSNPSMSGCREFFLSPRKSVVFNASKPTFMYYMDEHPFLDSHVRVLEEYGFVIDITSTNTPRYQLVEEFVDLLKG